MADPFALLVFLVALVATIIVVLYWLDSKKYMIVNVTSTIVRKGSGLFEAGLASNELMSQTGSFYYFPVEVYSFEMANGDTVNVSKADYDQCKIGEEYSYEKRVKKPQAGQPS